MCGHNASLHTIRGDAVVIVFLLYAGLLVKAAYPMFLYQGLALYVFISP